MDNKQQAYLDSFNRIAAFNIKYHDQLSTIDGYSVEEKKLNSAIKTISSGGIVQVGKDNPDEDTVATAKNAMANVVHKYTLRGMVKAGQLNNTSLAHALDEPVTYLTRAAQNLAVQRAQALRNLLNDNIGTLTNIKPENITEIDEAISVYDDMKGDPTQSIKERKAMGTDILPKAVQDGREAIENMYALVKSYLSDDDAELVNLFALDMEVTNTAVRHTTVTITAVADESNEPIENADVFDEKTEKHFTTDDEGLAELGKHINGDDTFVISAPGRQTVTIGVKIISRKENEFLVKLKKLV